MFENLKIEEYKEIDFEALKKKEEIDYIAQVSEQYWSEFERFVDCEKISGKELEKRLFDETKKAIDSIGEHCRSIGVIIYGKEVTESFEVELGWLTPNPLCEESDSSYTLYPSEQGFKIYDGLREIQGKLPIREANEKVRKRMFPE